MSSPGKVIFVSAACAVILVFILAIAASFWTYDQVATAAAIRQHTYLLITKSDIVMTALLDAESGQRGYSITGDEYFLEHYNTAISKISSGLRELQQLTAIPKAQESLKRTIPLSQALLADLARAVDLRRAGRVREELMIARTGGGKRLMDLIRAEKDIYTNIETDELLRQDAKLQSNMGSLLLIITIGSVLLLLLTVLSIYSIQQEAKNRVRRLLHLETKKLLDQQEETNHKLELSNLELQLSQGKLEVMLNSIGDAVLATDAGAQVILMNPVAQKLTGWTQVESLGHHVSEVVNIVDHDTRSTVPNPVIATLASGSIQALANHTILISRNGTECSIEDTCAPINDSDGNMTGTVLVFRDITKRRETEAKSERANIELNTLAAELKRTLLVKSEFLANMSHELRTPLNSIIGFSEALYDEIFGTLNEKQKKYTHNVLTSGNHLLLLINQILDMARVESGKMTLSVTTVPIGNLLNEIAHLVEHMAAKKELRLKIEIQEDLPVIEADELKVKEILYNLLSNAIKFTPAMGSAGIQAKQLGSEIEVTIWDTGIGIAAENMEKIFEGFFRVHTPYSQVTEGTGLGLPISKKLVELHGGRILVESEGLDKGSTVRFTLPIAPREVV